MRSVWTAQQVRESEAVLLGRTPEGALMRRAAFGVAVHARRMLAERGRVAGSRVVLLVGAGNNGGDALWAGAELRRRGVGVTAVLLDPARAHPAGLAALQRLGGRFVDADAGLVAELGADLVIDGIIGISGRGALREPAARLVAAIEHAGIPVLAVDLPSGVDPDTGLVDGPAVTAAATVTFGALKPVHALAVPRCGPVHLVDIGLGPLLPEPYAHVLDTEDVAQRWPVPGPRDDKYTQGVVGIAAGSSTYPGAAVLSAGAAALATSGMVRYAGAAAPGVRDHWPEVICTESVKDAGQVQAWSVGPGIGTDDAGRAVLADALAADAPMCIDADGITLLAHHAELRDAVRARPVVITPHDREFARVAGEVGPDRIAAARRAAAELDVTVLLKGNATVVAAPDGRVLVHPARGAWAATAGSGDVLTGILGSLLAAGLEPWWAAGCAAHVHELAADLAARGAPITASALQAAVPDAIRTVRGVSRLPASGKVASPGMRRSSRVR
jgi:hydroxyethylthiazole kinase-like uncharacterized protein yjeF